MTVHRTVTTEVTKLRDMPDVQALSLRNAQKIVQVCFFNPSSFLNNDDDDDDDDDDDADDDVDEDDDDDE